MRRLSLNRLGAGQKSGQNIPKNRCRTTIAERMVETRAELPFIGDQVLCLSHDQAARSRDGQSDSSLRRYARRNSCAGAVTRQIATRQITKSAQTKLSNMTS